MSFKTFETFLNEAKGAGGINMNSIPDAIINALDKENKKDQFTDFVNNLPGGESTSVMVQLFNEMAAKPAYLAEFVENLWTVKDPNKIDPKLYQTNGSFGQYIFNQKPVGVGRGELFLAWIMNKSSIQGGSVNYDLEVDGQKFEVKDYRVPDKEEGQKSSPSPNAPIRLGEKGKVTQFSFWNEIIDTLRRLDKLVGLSQGNAKFDFTTTFDDKEFVEIVQNLLSRQGKILSGECNKTDFANLKTFYKKVSDVKLAINGYTNIILRGPGEKPVEMMIKPITVDQVNQKVIQLEPAETVDQLSYIITELRRIKYARNPSDFDKDLQDVVNKIIGNIPFIIFRKSGINVTTEFVFDSVSQGGVKIVEKSIADSKK